MFDEKMDPNVQVEKKQKYEQDECPNIPKSNTRQSTDNSRGEEAPKENYIHVRARRGQATNSHSLAERTTGKAVMLDEIINYVESLQQQVEIAALIPYLSFDAGKPLLMDVNSHRAGSTTTRLSNPGSGPFPLVLPGMPKGTLPVPPSTAEYLSLSQVCRLLSSNSSGFIGFTRCIRWASTPIQQIY